MKNRVIERWTLQSVCQWVIRVALVVLLAPTTLSADEPSSNGEEVKTEHPVSSFVMPRSRKEGRDPFHPDSTWMFAVTPTPDPKPDSGPAKLELKGISGTVERPLAIINNRTLAVGEEQDVTTSQGRRVRVMCLEINGTKVKIRAQGQTRELMMRKGI